MNDRFGAKLELGDWVIWVESNYIHHGKVLGSTTPNNLIIGYEEDQFLEKINLEETPGYPKLRRSVVKLKNEPIKRSYSRARGWVYENYDSIGTEIFVKDLVTYAETAGRMGKGQVVKIARNNRGISIVTIFNTDGRMKRREAYAVGIVDDLNVVPVGV